MQPHFKLTVLMKAQNLFLYSILLILIWSCGSEDITISERDIILSSENEIISFRIPYDNANYTGVVRGDSIKVIMPNSVKIDSLTPVISVSEGATINPKSGAVQNFSNPVTYKVTAEDGSEKTYVAYIDLVSADNQILSFQFESFSAMDNQYALSNQNPNDIDTLTFTVAKTVDISQLKSKIIISEGATINPTSGSVLDYTNPIKYTVTAQNRDKKEYLVRVNKNQPLEFESFSFLELSAEENNYQLNNQNATDIDTLVFTVASATDITKLTSKIELAETLSISPTSGETLDYSNPVKYTISNQQEETKDFLDQVVKESTIDYVRIIDVEKDSFENVSANEIITFKANQFNSIESKNKVRLLAKSDGEVTELEVVSIDYENALIQARLPQSYVNGLYYLELEVDSGVKDQVEIILLQDIPAFNYIPTYQIFGGDTYPNYYEYKQLVWAGEQFSTNTYLDYQNLDKYKFYLGKDNQDFEFSQVFLNGATDVRVIMPVQPVTFPQLGQGFEFVIEYKGQKYRYPLVNEMGEEIAVIKAEAPVINGINKTVFKYGEVIELMGENLFYPNKGGLKYASTLYFNDGGRFPETLKGGGIDGATDIAFTVANSLDFGYYMLQIENNIADFDRIDTGIEVEIRPENLDSPTFRSNDVYLYSKESADFAKQIKITLNRSPENSTINKLYLRTAGLSDDILFDSYEVNGNVIILPTLSDSDFDTVWVNDYSYIIIDITDEMGNKYSFSGQITHD